MRSRGVVAVALAVLLGLAAAPARAPVAAAAAAHGRPPMAQAVLTKDGPRYRIAQRDGRVRVRVPASPNTENNRRGLFWRPRADATRRQVSCATWVYRSHQRVQEGVAVRIRDRRGRVRAITVTKNIAFDYRWVFNLLTWDTDRSGAPWRAVAQFDMSPVLRPSGHAVAPRPWRVCLRATGRQVAVKVWLPDRTTQPRWSDPVHVRRARLPRGFAAAGVPGWYVGHLGSGQRLVYEGLRTR